MVLWYQRKSSSLSLSFHKTFLGWWSTALNEQLTLIGNAVFVTMDISDVFLAVRFLFSFIYSHADLTLFFPSICCIQLAKCVNYSEGPDSSGIGSTVFFGWFVIVWTWVCSTSCLKMSTNGPNSLFEIRLRYLRHYLNFIILRSVWFQFDLIPYVFLLLLYVPLFHLFIWRGSHSSGVVGLSQRNGTHLQAFGWLLGWSTKSYVHGFSISASQAQTIVAF